jgi:hypothetical protein
MPCFYTSTMIQKNSDIPLKSCIRTVGKFKIHARMPRTNVKGRQVHKASEAKTRYIHLHTINHSFKIGSLNPTILSLGRTLKCPVCIIPGGICCRNYFNIYSTQQRHITENSKQIFPEKELQGLSPNFHIHVSVSDL